MPENNVRPVVSHEQDLSLPVGLEPSFKLSEGTRQELNLNGYAMSPFTGQLLVGTGDSPRAATREEFDKAQKEAAKRETERPNKGTSFSSDVPKPAPANKRVVKD